MLKQIPKEKITMGKRVLRAEEKEDHVLVHCSDGSTYRGDILIGADGAYSGVRQSLYRYLDEHGILPKSDLEDLSIGYTCMVGVAEPKDVDKYPQLKEPYAYLSSAVGGNRQIVSDEPGFSGDCGTLYLFTHPLTLFLGYWCTKIKQHTKS